MLKLNASFSKKVPVPGQDYSSKGYSATIEVELPDGLSQEQLQERIHNTFALVEASVEAELQSNNVSARQSIPSVPKFANSANNHSYQQKQKNTDTAPASPKQIKFLTDIARKANISIEGYLHNYGLNQINELNRQQCSYLIDEMKKQAA